MPIWVAPYQHQRNAFTSALESFNADKSRVYALLMEMGTGKTITSIGIAGALYLTIKYDTYI